MKNKFAWWLATVFGCGLVPLAPGTVGSLAGLGAAFLLIRYLALPPFCLLILALGMIPLAFWSAGVAAHMIGAWSFRFFLQEGLELG